MPISGEPSFWHKTGVSNFSEISAFRSLTSRYLGRLSKTVLPPFREVMVTSTPLDLLDLGAIPRQWFGRLKPKWLVEHDVIELNIM